MTQGESNIDLIIVNGGILTAMQDWEVSDICTRSDHNLITYKLNRQPSGKCLLLKQRNFNTGLAHEL